MAYVNQLYSLKHLAGQIIARQKCLGLLLLLCNYEDELLQYILCWLSMADILMFSMGLGHHHRLPQPLTSCAYYSFIVDLYKVQPKSTWTEHSFTAYFRCDTFCFHWLEWYDLQCQHLVLNKLTKACLVFSDYQSNAILYVEQFCLTLYVHVMRTPTLANVYKMRHFFQQGMANPIIILNTHSVTTMYKTFLDALFQSGNFGDIQLMLSSQHRQFHFMKIIFMQDGGVIPPLSQLPCPSLKSLTPVQKKWLSQLKLVPQYRAIHESYGSWYNCQPLTFPISDSSCSILKEMLHGICHMRMGRFYFALINWYTVLSFLKTQAVYSFCKPFSIWAMSKFIQTLIALNCPVESLLPLFQAFCTLSLPYVDQNMICQTAHSLLAQHGCYSLSKLWLEPLTDTTTCYTNRFSFDILISHVRECFLRVEDLLALEFQRLVCANANAQSAFPTASTLQRFQPIKSVLFRIHFLLTQKLQPALNRFYFNRYMLYTIELLNIQYDVILVLLQKHHLDLQWILKNISMNVSELRRRIQAISQFKDLMLPHDVQYVSLKRFQTILDPTITSEQFSQHCLAMRDTIIVKRTLQDGLSLEEAHHFFSYGVLAHGFELNKPSFPYFRRALHIYEKQSVAPPRLALCRLLAQAEDRLFLTHTQDLDHSLMTFDYASSVVPSKSTLETIKTILKTVNSVDHSLVDARGPVCTNQHHPEWNYFNFDYLKTIAVFRSAFQQHHACPHAAASGL